ncbi:MAG: DNA polymerase III subunit delta [Armatimonadota bacterium]|nr:DNA polymerase III subunit delta [Armatimonadota bacterium]
MQLSYATIAGKRRIEPLARAYLFEGREDAQKQEALDKLTSQVMEADSADFDLDLCEGAALTAQRLFSTASMPPFISTKRMIVIRRANTIPSAEQEVMAQKLPGLPQSAVVVFIVPAPELKDGSPKAGSNLSAKLSHAIAEVGAVVSFAQLRADDAAREIGRKFTEAGKKIEGPALRRLVDRVGSDLSILETEARKLIDYAGDREAITIKDVELLTGQKPEERIWKLLDAVGARDTPLALRLLRESFESGGRIEGEAQRTLALVLRQLRLIWQARTFADRGWRLQSPPEQASQILPADNNLVAFSKRSQFLVQRLRDQARNFTLADLERCFEYAAAADLALKGIEGEIEDPAVIMELLLINLCRRRRK